MFSPMNIITPDNWTFCHFKTVELKAFISMSGAPSLGHEVQVNYVVTLTDLEHQELFQSEFNDLSSAVSCLNDRYGHWEFFDAENPPETDGCSTCDNN
jgi:hypothetical protein